ncbi:hypothetical protein MTR67_042840 [Solanum verrucosum]|uniref:Uncharacterized protein n=1 Tax=Solanum verrucosum TaxID=315347 RepID=A0AAF0UP85_SOLVR|nr:hypothetical protein MTR67_042840 [Solanum verrucosum]
MVSACRSRPGCRLGV